MDYCNAERGNIGDKTSWGLIRPIRAGLCRNISDQSTQLDTVTWYSSTELSHPVVTQATSLEGEEFFSQLPSPSLPPVLH
jgi:hypothetical protein